MNEGQTIPVSELDLPDKVALPELSSEDAFRLLTAKIRRGRAISVVLFIIAFVGILFALVIYHRPSWAVVSGIGCIAFKVWAALSQQKVELAQRICGEPLLVYWAHPRRSTVRGYELLLTLHSRTGQSLEVAVSREQMLTIVAWMRRHNSSVRCGAYDDTQESK